MADEILLTIIGGLIAGGAGVAAVYAQQWFVRRDWVWDHVLGLVYNFVRTVTDPAFGDRWEPDPWETIGWYDRTKVRRRLRDRIDDFSRVVRGYYDARTEFDHHVSGATQERLHSNMRRILGNYVQGDHIEWARFGKEGGGYWQFTEFFNAVYPEIVRHPSDSDATWRAVEQVGQGRWSLLVTRLRRQDPEVLDRIHLVLMADPAFEKAEPLLQSADAWREAATGRAWALRRILERRRR